VSSKFYICGDSFSDIDPLYTQIVPWVEQIPGSINLALKCASNTMISLQVDDAISNNANFIRVNFTSCTRGEFVDNNEIIPYTRINTVGDQLPKEIRTVVDMYTMQVFNLELEIYKNKCLIESVLQRLVDSGIPFSFDQGGFEHPTFGATQTYFTKYNAYRSKYNLWDYGDSKIHRPYFHITKQLVHNEIAEYYREKTR
jgi:hypothetical protein